VIQYLSLILFSVAAVAGLFQRRVAYFILILSSVLFAVSMFDPMNESTYFPLIASIVWSLVGFYSLSYGEHYGKWLAVLLSITILGMAIILVSTNYLIFIVGWEVMSIPSYAIIAMNRRDSSAAFTFMVFSEISTAFLIAGALYSFSLTGFTSFAFVNTHSAIPLLLIGFGALIKMGMTPFLISEWLPIAHGSAPANASAVFSSTMTLMGVYILFRLTEQSTMGAGFYYVGIIFLIIGGMSVFFASMYAYISENMKMLGGFSTIENQAAILSAFGLILISSDPVLREFVMISIIIFAFSHAISKTGLFLSVGNSDSEYFSDAHAPDSMWGKIGALLSIMSLSGLFPTIGGLAVWMLLESFFMQAFMGGYTGIIAIIAGSILAISEGMATGAMLKIISFTSLFNTRPGKNRSIQNSTVFFIGISVLLLFLVAVLIVPKSFLSGIPSILVYNGFMIESIFTTGDFGLISPLYVAVLISVFSLFAYGVFGKPKTRIAPAWNSGRSSSAPYTSFAFSDNMRLMLKRLLRTRTGSYGQAMSVVDVFWSGMVLVGVNYRKACRVLSRIFMNSSIGWYMIYMILAFMLTMLIAALLY